MYKLYTYSKEEKELMFDMLDNDDINATVDSLMVAVLHNCNGQTKKYSDIFVDAIKKFIEKKCDKIDVKRLENTIFRLFFFKPHGKHQMPHLTGGIKAEDFLVFLATNDLFDVNARRGIIPSSLAFKYAMNEKDRLSNHPLLSWLYDEIFLGYTMGAYTRK